MHAKGTMLADVQAEALRLFLGLRAYRASWRGALLLGVGLHRAGQALALASLAAGAAAIFLEEDAAAIRAAQQQGCVTFSVTTLAEAVRILKNDVRRSSAVCVALRSTAEIAMAEMLRRGVQPNALAFNRAAVANEITQACELVERGSVVFREEGLWRGNTCVDLRREADASLRSEWEIVVDVTDSFQERRARDRELLAAAQRRSGNGDPRAALAVEWLHLAFALQHRMLTRAFLAPVGERRGR